MQVLYFNTWPDRENKKREMLWLHLIFCSPPNFCRTFCLLWDLNLTHCPIIKHSSSFWKQKTAQRNQCYALQSNLMWNHNRSCRTRTFTGIVFLSSCLSPALTSFLSFSCPLVSLRLKSLSLSLSAAWLPLIYHTHMPKHGSAMTLQHFPIPALN